MYIIIFFLFCFFPDNFFTIFFVDYERNAKNEKYKTKRKRRNNLSLSSVQSEQRRTWSIFHQSVDVVLGAVLRRGHFENVGHALQRLLRVPIRHHLVGRDAHAKPQQTKDVKTKQVKMNRNRMFFTCKMVKFSRTLFIMYFSGKCLSLWMKLIMYSHMGERWMR